MERMRRRLIRAQEMIRRKDAGKEGDEGTRWEGCEGC